MLLIADSGSTKTDWRLIYNNNIEQYSSIGLNPNFIDASVVAKVVKDTLPKRYHSEINQIIFYGAGCSSQHKSAVLSNGIQRVFKLAKIEIHHDLLGAARAASGTEKSIVGILGTGSNTCLYNGSEIIKEYRSGGFIIGDEGGGVDIGKHVVKAFIEEKLDEELLHKFNHRYSIAVDEILYHLYQQPQPNAFLANFSQFAFHNKEHPLIADLLQGVFQSFFQHKVARFQHAESLPLNLVGSIAYYYQEIIKTVALDNKIQIGRIIEKPISGLTLFHTGLD